MTPKENVDHDFLKKLDSMEVIIDDFVKKTGTNQLVVCFHQLGRERVYKRFGKNTASFSREYDFYPLSSLTKQFAGVLVAMMLHSLPYQDGQEFKQFSHFKNDQNVTLDKFASYFPVSEGDRQEHQLEQEELELLRKVFFDTSLHELVTHRIYFEPNNSRFLAADQSPGLSKASFLAEMKDIPIEKLPVGSEIYSNAAYVLVGILIEHIFKDSFENTVTKYILKPLGLSCTMRPNSSKIPRHYNQRVDKSTHEIKTPICPASSPWAAAAGINSSLEDFSKFRNILARLYLATSDKETFEGIKKDLCPDFLITREAIRWAFGTGEHDQHKPPCYTPLGYRTTTGTSPMDLFSLDGVIADTETSLSTIAENVPVYVQSGLTTGFSLQTYFFPTRLFNLTVVSNTIGVTDVAGATSKFLIDGLLSENKLDMAKRGMDVYLKLHLAGAEPRLRRHEALDNPKPYSGETLMNKIAILPKKYTCATSSWSLCFTREGDEIFVRERFEDCPPSGRFLLKAVGPNVARIVPTNRPNDPILSIDRFDMTDDFTDLVFSETASGDLIIKRHKQKRHNESGKTLTYRLS